MKSNIAEGSILSRGTHVWLEILDYEGQKTTFSGSKQGGMLHVLRDYKRDFDREHHRGLLEILPPEGMSENDWTEAVIMAAVEIENEMHGNYAFNGIWPRGKTRSGVPRSNCCRVVVNIIERAGGKIPNGRVKGVLPGLGRGWRDYL